MKRTISAGLEFLLDASANLLEGKRRWPHLGPIPWPAIAAVAAESFADGGGLGRFQGSVHGHRGPGGADRLTANVCGEVLDPNGVAHDEQHAEAQQEG